MSVVIFGCWHSPGRLSVCKKGWLMKQSGSLHKKEMQKNGLHKKKTQKKTMQKKTAQKKKQPVLHVPSEWLYLALEKGSLRDIYVYLKEEKRWKTEYWEEAKVLEISIPDAGSVDLEALEADSEDAELFDYMEEQGMKAVYAVTIMPEHYMDAEVVMRYIVEKAGGMFCGDTDDFLPEVKAIQDMIHKTEELQGDK